jgi:hypothetical protein
MGSLGQAIGTLHSRIVENSMATEKKANTRGWERIRIFYTGSLGSCGEGLRPFQAGPSRHDKAGVDPHGIFFHLIRMMIPSTERSIRKITEADLKVGLICADRDGNRIRIDNVERDDRGSGTVSYHFLNDELRVQEGVQERTIEQFLGEGWVVAAAGTSL